MAAQLGQTPQTIQPPPVPPGIDAQTALYLQQFTMWCAGQFNNRLSSNSALPGVMLQASDAPAGTTPAVFHLQVKTDGTVVANPLAIGTGSP
jgi:hypothetical protein